VESGHVLRDTEEEAGVNGGGWDPVDERTGAEESEEARATASEAAFEQSEAEEGVGDVGGATAPAGVPRITYRERMIAAGADATAPGEVAAGSGPQSVDIAGVQSDEVGEEPAGDVEEQQAPVDGEHQAREPQDAAGGPDPAETDDSAVDAGADDGVGGESELQLEIRGRSAWVRLRAGERVLVDGMLGPGERRTFRSSELFFLDFLTDRDAVVLRLDGEAVALPPARDAEDKAVSDFPIRPRD
jgi:hypothetical protein